MLAELHQLLLVGWGLMLGAGNALECLMWNIRQGLTCSAAQGHTLSQRLPRRLKSGFNSVTLFNLVICLCA